MQSAPMGLVRGAQGRGCGRGRGYGQCTQRNGDKVAGQRREHGDEDDRKVFTYFLLFWLPCRV